MDRLSGKVAIVTGAAAGLGRATAELYAEEGARVVVSDVNDDEGQETTRRITDAGGDALYVHTDVADSGAVRDLVAATEEHYGRLDVMTANAGILGRGAFKNIEDVSDEEFAEVMDVNIGGVFHCLRYAVPAIKRVGGGAMTATSSLAAHRGVPHLDGYAASKGAVNALVRSLAVELAPHIRVNSVSAGTVRTDIRSSVGGGRDLPPRAADTVAGKMPRPIAEPRQLAFVHLFLVSDEGSFVNGHALVADGGRSIVSA